jgi:hypothetical protein
MIGYAALTALRHVTTVPIRPVIIETAHTLCMRNLPEPLVTSAGKIGDYAIQFKRQQHR